MKTMPGLGIAVSQWFAKINLEETEEMILGLGIAAMSQISFYLRNLAYA